MSMISDMGKIDGNKKAGMLGMAVLMDPNINEDRVRSFIEGFAE